MDGKWEVVESDNEGKGCERRENKNIYSTSNVTDGCDHQLLLNAGSSVMFRTWRQYPDLFI